MQSNIIGQSQISFAVLFTEVKMDNTDQNVNVGKYLKDIETIKSLLIEADEKPLIEYWAFITWGIFIIIGSIIQFFTAAYFSLTITDIIFKIWAPILAIAGLFETVAWIQKMAKESIPLLSKLSIKLFASCTLTIVVFIVLFNILINANLSEYLPVIVCFMIGTMFIIFGTLTYTPMLYFSSFLIIFGTVLYFINIQNEYMTLITGIVIAGTSITAGISSKINMREK